MMISDWEVGALYNNLRKRGDKPDVAAEKIQKKFYTQLCSDKFNTHFFVGTTLRHQASWIILGLFYLIKPFGLIGVYIAAFAGNAYPAFWSFNRLRFKIAHGFKNENN